MVMTRLLQCRGMFNLEQLASYACLSRESNLSDVFAACVGITAETILTGDSFLYAIKFRKSGAGG